MHRHAHTLRSRHCALSGSTSMWRRPCSSRSRACVRAASHVPCCFCCCYVHAQGFADPDDARGHEERRRAHGARLAAPDPRAGVCGASEEAQSSDTPHLHQGELTRQERITRQRALDRFSLPSFQATCRASRRWVFTGVDVRQRLPDSASPQDRGVSDLLRGRTKTFQLNIGLYCNQACTHCHVESSPKRCARLGLGHEQPSERCTSMAPSHHLPTTLASKSCPPNLTRPNLVCRKEMMDRATADQCIRLMRSSPSVETVDITGGAPELNEQFR